MFTKDFFILALSQNIGVEGARKQITEALVTQRLPEKTEYSKEEALKITEHLCQQTGIVKIMGNLFATKIRIAAS